MAYKRTATPRKSSMGATVTKKPRNGGASSTETKRLATTSSSEFNSNGKMKKTATPMAMNRKKTLRANGGSDTSRLTGSKSRLERKKY